MASPFNVFRKHQKVIIVAAGVLCMFVFVIGDVLFQLVPSGPRGGASDYDFDDVAVRWEGGELTLGEVQGLVTQRSILRNFLQTVTAMGMQATGTPPDARRVMELNGREQAPQRTAVYRHLMAEAARDAGVVISDAAINQYLGQLTQGQISGDQLRQIASSLKVNNRRAGMNFIFEALRQEMLAETYWHSYLALVGTITPHQRWEDWAKFNDRVVIESVALPVGDFVDEVPDPTDQELRDFYEAYKDRAPTNVLVQPYTELPSPEPGFRIPRRVEVHYIEANYENLVAQIAAEIPQEEIRQYYEEHKETFVKPQFDFGDQAESTDTTQPAAEGDQEAAADAGEADGTAGAEQPEPNAETGQSGPAATETTTDAADDGDDGSEAEQAETDVPPPGAADDAAPADAQSSHLLIPAAEATHYVAFQQDGQPDSAGSDNGELSSIDDVDAGLSEGSLEGAPPSPAGPDEDARASAEDTATGSNPFADAGGEADRAAPADALQGPGGTLQGPDQPDLEGLPPEPPEPADGEAAGQVEYLPLEDVEEEIRQRIADSRVPERLQKIMPEIYGELARAYREYENRRLDAEELGEDPAQVRPPAYDLQQLAEDYGLEARQTPLLSQLELQKTPLGESLVQETSLPYWLYAFSQQQRYQPVHTGLTVSAFEQALGRFNEYVAVKMDDQPARTPPLDEIREEVVRRYKRVKARELAMAAAEELAEKAEGTDEPLQQQFAESDEYEVVESDPFSWYADTPGSQLFHLGKPFGVEHAGPEFMEKVFSLERGEVAAVWNHDKSVAYVVRLDQHQLSQDALQNLFLQEANRSQVLQKTAMYRQQQLYQSLVADLIADANVEWVIPPDVREVAT